MVGAVLTQKTNWRGVEMAITNLKGNGLLSVDKLNGLATSELARLIRPSGYFNLKARRLKNLIELVVEEYGGDLDAMRREKTNRLRRVLLAVDGIGPETADSILLYAFNRATFVIDTYTRRVFSRHDLVEPTAAYQEMQDVVMQYLPADASMFNEYHALLVNVGKLHCKRRPNCQDCPLEPLLPQRWPVVTEE
jgi:endonuclease-3 related protein